MLSGDGPGIKKQRLFSTRLSESNEEWDSTNIEANWEGQRSSDFVVKNGVFPI